MKKILIIILILILPLMALAADLFKDGFESGTTNQWDAVVDTESDMTVTEAAALNGNYGLNLIIDNQTEMYVRDDTPAAETRYRVRFYVDVNSLTMINGTSLVLCSGRKADTTTAFNIFLEKFNNEYKISASDRADGAWNKFSGYVTITDAPHWVEFDWMAATSDGADDGYYIVWVDGVEKKNIVDIDSDQSEITHIRFGAASISANVSGTLFLDDFASNDDGSEIGEYIEGINVINFGCNF